MKNDDDDILKFMRMKELYSLNIKRLEMGVYGAQKRNKTIVFSV